MRLLLVLSVLLVLTQDALSQWGGGSCVPVGTPGNFYDQTYSPRFEWRVNSADPQRRYLYFNNSLIGGWDIPDQYYRPFSQGQWGQRCQPPVSPPQDAIRAQPSRPPQVSEDRDYGVDRSRISNSERFRCRGIDVNREDALREIQNSIPSDQGLIRLTIIGPEAARQQVRRDLETNPELQPFRSRLLIQDYPPDHWAVSPGFVTSGNPTIYIQRPDGAVLHRQNDYQGGAAGLAYAIRRADPNYRPDADPDLRQPTPSPSPTPVIDPAGIWAWIMSIGRTAWLAIGSVVMAVLLLYTKRGA